MVIHLCCRNFLYNSQENVFYLVITIVIHESLIKLCYYVMIMQYI